MVQKLHNCLHWYLFGVTVNLNSMVRLNQQRLLPRLRKIPLPRFPPSLLALLQTRLHHKVINILFNTHRNRIASRLLNHRKHKYPELLVIFLRYLPEHLVKIGIQSVLRHVHLNNIQPRFNKVLQLLPCTREYHPRPTDRVKESKHLNDMLPVQPNRLFHNQSHSNPISSRMFLHHMQADHTTFQALLHHRVTLCMKHLLHKRLDHPMVRFLLANLYKLVHILILLAKRLLLKHLGKATLLSQAIPFE